MDVAGPGDAMETDLGTVRSGRPRDPRLDEAIVAATLDLLAQHGYAGLSLAAVAAQAGTTKPAIYRRWASKRELVLEAVFRTQGDDVVADTGDLDADVRTMVRWSLQKFGSPAGRAALAGLLAEPVVADDGAGQQLAGVWRRMGERFQRASERGEIRADADTGLLIVMHAGPALMAAAVYGEAAVDDRWVERIATAILDGVRKETR